MIDIDRSLGFIVLNPENDPLALRATVRTIGEYYQHCSAVCVLGRGQDVEDCSRVSRVICGGDTISSLIDAGLEDARPDWCFVVIAGTKLRSRSLYRYRRFVTGERDILYPVVDRKWAFDEASINGILMPRRCREEVGAFGDANHSLQLVKMLWAIEAIAKNYQFKALVGARIV